MKILIADDNIDFCSTIAEIVQSLGFETETANHPDIALKYLDKEHRNIAMALFDIEFGPKVQTTGLDMLEYSRKRYPAIPVVMISGKGSIETAVRATKLGALNFIEKSIVSKEKIKSVIDSALEKVGNNGEVNEIRQFLAAHGLIGKSARMMEIGDHIIRFGRTDLNILITGETGTGKKLVAKAIHAISRRMKQPFVTVDIPNIPKELFQSELFGHLKGSFSGATENKRGLFQEANRGTLFLDEIGEMSLELQSNLFIPVEEKTVRRVGSVELESIDVRFISATDQDLISKMRNSQFREPLYHRLRECEIYLPPLRDRAEDIPAIVEFHLKLHNEQFSEGRFFSPSAISYMQEQKWNGNVRELASMIRVTLQTAKSDQIEVTDIHRIMSQNSQVHYANEANNASQAISTQLSSDGTLKEELAQVDIKKIELTLEKCLGNVSKAAAMLGVSRETLHNKIRRYEINVQQFRDKRHT